MVKMKDSGVEWCEKIPSHWKVKHNKYLMRKHKLLCPKYDGEDILSLTMKGVIIRDLDAGGKMPASFNGYQKVYPGNLLMCLFDYDVTPRCIGLVEKTGLCSPAYSQFVMKDNNSSKYYYYYYLMLDNTKELLHLAKNLRHSFTEEQLGEILTPVPPVPEQNKIADFLDKKCTEIDSLSEDIQKEIDLLEEYKKSVITEAVTKGLNPDVEMKDSGVFYLGKTNPAWKITKLGYVCSKLVRSFNPDDTALICSNKGQIIERGNSVIGLMSSEDNAMQGIHSGDIAIHGMDTWHGAIALSTLTGKITRVVHVCASSEDHRFIVYFLKYLAIKNVYKLISNGVRGNTSDFRSWEKVKQISISLPSIIEQNDICDYLDSKCLDIDYVIAEKQKQLSTLSEYKKSIIYEYVTGKKEVI
ncbi:restriction endonuclease subunit S [Succinivibrio sp.]|uniref:restriction endonuclease subunit S n=1 Tax=Succinivibrio sp. TaxID=2053619 RepID=UPI003863BED2